MAKKSNWGWWVTAGVSAVLVGTFALTRTAAASPRLPAPQGETPVERENRLAVQEALPQFIQMLQGLFDRIEFETGFRPAGGAPMEYAQEYDEIRLAFARTLDAARMIPGSDAMVQEWAEQWLSVTGGVF